MNKEEYFLFLDDLRESGVTNMFGAVPYLTINYPVVRDIKRRIINGKRL